jgi:nitrite reductase/ring-hydroxylating ferredoxin subunit
MPDILCPVSEITEAGKEVVFERGGKRSYLMLFRHAGGIVAYHNVCPHQGRNLNFAPDRFLFDPAGRLVCPHHGALFEVGDGHCIQGPCQGAALRSVQVSVTDDAVILEDPGLLQT